MTREFGAFVVFVFSALMVLSAFCALLTGCEKCRRLFLGLVFMASFLLVLFGIVG